MKKINTALMLFLFASLGAMVKEVDKTEIGAMAPKEAIRKVLIRTQRDPGHLEKELQPLTEGDMVIVKKPTQEQKRSNIWVPLFPLSAPTDYVYGVVVDANPLSATVQYGPDQKDRAVYERVQIIKPQ